MSTIIGKVHNPEKLPTDVTELVELLDSKNAAQRLYSCEVDHEGKYSLNGVDEGSYMLFSATWGKDKRYYWEIPVKIGLDETIHIDFLADTAQVLQ